VKTRLKRRKDRSMLRVARLVVAMLQAEGAAAEALAAADVIVHSINDGTRSVLHPAAWSLL
jgi:soluble P-type ATPase